MFLRTSESFAPVGVCWAVSQTSFCVHANFYRGSKSSSITVAAVDATSCARTGDEAVQDHRELRQRKQPHLYAWSHVPRLHPG